MKATLYIVSLCIGLLSGVLSIYSGWLLYHHVKATELMWFLWWLNTLSWLPLLFLSKAVEIISKKES